VRCGRAGSPVPFLLISRRQDDFRFRVCSHQFLREERTRHVCDGLVFVSRQSEFAVDATIPCGMSTHLRVTENLIKLPALDVLPSSLLRDEIEPQSAVCHVPDRIIGVVCVVVAQQQKGFSQSCRHDTSVSTGTV
jgi:hypothetical protein